MFCFIRVFHSLSDIPYKDGKEKYRRRWVVSFSTHRTHPRHTPYSSEQTDKRRRQIHIICLWLHRFRLKGPTHPHLWDFQIHDRWYTICVRPPHVFPFVCRDVFSLHSTTIDLFALSTSQLMMATKLSMTTPGASLYRHFRSWWYISLPPLDDFVRPLLCTTLFGVVCC